MTKFMYYKYPAENIDITNKMPVDKGVKNYALNILENDSFKNSEKHQYIKALIIELNKIIKDKKNPVPEIANVINYWLFVDM